MKKPMLKKTAALVLSAGMLMLSFSPFASSATFSGFGLCVYAQESDEIIANNASGIPDKILYDIVLETGDSNKDGVLTKEEAENITTVRAAHAGIKDLTGIQYLKKMAFLDVTDNQISDISMKPINGFLPNAISPFCVEGPSAITSPSFTLSPLNTIGRWL